MSFSLSILFASGFAYLGAFLSHVLSFNQVQEKGHRIAFGLLRVGFVISFFYFAAKAVESHLFIPVANLSEAFAFFAWSIAFVYLVLLSKIQTDSFGIILTPILALLIMAAILSNHLYSKPFNLPGHPLFMVHIVSAYFAYAGFTVSFAAGILYLIQNHELKSKKPGTFYHKLSSLEELEKLTFKPMVWGAFLLVIAIVVGSFWSKVAFEEYLLFNPKMIATLVTLVVYVTILALRHFNVLRVRQGAILTLIAFFIVMITFLGPRLLHGSHYVRT